MNISKLGILILRGEESFLPKLFFVYTGENVGGERVCVCFFFTQLCSSCLFFSCFYIKICILWIFMHLIGGSYIP